MFHEMVGLRFGLNQMESTKGGTYIRSNQSMSLHGVTSNILQLSKPYTFNQFSKLKLSLTTTTETMLLYVCLLEERQMYEEFRFSSCLQFAGNGGEIIQPTQRSPASRYNDTNNKAETPILFYNLAFGKPTRQSSYHDNVLSISNNAVDGKLESSGTSKIETTVALTEVEKDPWWEVELEKLYPISKVILYFDEDELTDRSGLVISLYDELSTITFQKAFET